MALFFNYCIACPSINDFWLPLWYFQTFISSNCLYKRVAMLFSVKRRLSLPLASYGRERVVMDICQTKMFIEIQITLNWKKCFSLQFIEQKSTTNGFTRNPIHILLKYFDIEVSYNDTQLINWFSLELNEGSSYGSWIYNYLCNQWLSPLTLWVRIPLGRGELDTTLCDKVC